VAINQIRLNPSAVARALGAVAFLLVLASIGGQLFKYLLGRDHVYGLVRLFYVDAEQNIPTLFSVLQLLCAALLLTVITVLKKEEKDPDVSRWAILAFGFLLMAIDEASSIHEKLIRPVHRLLGDGPFGIFYFAWVIPGIAIVFVLTLFFLRFLLRLPAKTRFTFMVAGTLFIGGALGLELVGGRYAELHGQRNLTYSMIATVEESLEMAGVIVFIYALLKYIADNYNEVRFRFDSFEGNSRSKAPNT
jgi:hypothetical protein